MSAKKRKTKKANRGARKTRSRSSGPETIGSRLALVLHELALILGPLAVVFGFFEPWLIVETNPLAQALLDLPESAILNAPALPGYAHEVEKSWVVELVRLFEEDHPDSGRIWWVYASPASAVLSYLVLKGRSLVGSALVLIAQGFVALLGTSKLIEGLSEFNSESLRLHFGYGLAIATLGHALILAMALKVLDRSLMRRLFWR